MVARRDIQAFVDDMVRRFRPERVILFGSYAYGKPHADSDVDLMVIMPHRGAGAKKATEIRLACPRSFPLDLIVRSAAEVDKKVRDGDVFLSEVTTKGVVLHEGGNARVD